MIRINLNKIFYTHVEHSPIKNSLYKVLYGNAHTHTMNSKVHNTDHYNTCTRVHVHTHAQTHTHTHTDYDCSRNWILILVRAKIL